MNIYFYISYLDHIPWLIIVFKPNLQIILLIKYQKKEKKYTMAKTNVDNQSRKSIPRSNIKQTHGRTMKSSNTNHVLNSAQSSIKKQARAHNGQTKRAASSNALIVHQMNLRSTTTINTVHVFP